MLRDSMLALLALALILVGCADSTSGDTPDAGADGAPDQATGQDASIDTGPDVGEPSLARLFPEDFRFGVATAAHQVEGGQHNTWSLFENLPQFSGFTAEPSGLATDHYHRYAEDFDLAAGLGMDVFRLSIEWSRIEPARGSYDEDEIAHYHDVFDAMAERGLQPSVTLHHFAEPTWWVDLTKVSEPYLDTFCADGPSDADFCAWTNEDAPAVFAAFCARMAAEYGDQVDEWMTFNEPQAYWVASTVTGEFPPPLGLPLTGTTSEDLARFSVPTLRNMLAAHVACYDAIHENDTVDADGDGQAAVVGLATGTGAARPAREGNEDDIAAAKQAEWVATFLFFDAIVSGELDTDFDMEPDEPHPDWAGKIDILGLQYYASTTVLGVALHPMLWGIPCMNLEGEDELLALELQLGCPPPPTNDFPLGDGDNPQVFGRQHDPEGLLEVLTLLNERYPALPLVITGERLRRLPRQAGLLHRASPRRLSRRGRAGHPARGLLPLVADGQLRVGARLRRALRSVPHRLRRRPDPHGHRGRRGLRRHRPSPRHLAGAAGPVRRRRGAP